MKYIKFIITIILVVITGTLILQLYKLLFDNSIILEMTLWLISFLFGFNLVRINKFIWNIED